MKLMLPKNLDNKKVGIVALLAIGLLLLLVVFLNYLKPESEVKRLPEFFPITGAYQAYFEIETAIDTSNVAAGDEVPIDIYLTTSGEGFDIAVAKLEWNENDFSYKNLSAQGQLNGRFVDARVGGASNLDNNRILTHYVVPAEGDPAMQLASGTRTKFASLVLNALVDGPVSTVALSSLTDDLAARFINSGVDNSVDQSLADQTKIKVEFYLCTSGEKRCEGNTPQTCSADRKSWLDQTACTVDQYCLDGVCIDYICGPGETRCYNNSVQICSSDRMNWQTQQTCTSDQYCDDASFSCVDYVCQTGEKRCYNNSVQICSSDRMNWQTQQTCTSDQYCEGNFCLDYVCNTGEKRCEGNTPQTCSADRKSWLDQTACTVDQYCLDGVCIDYICQIGEKRCNGDIAQTCAADRMSWVESTDEAVCGSGNECKAGECLPLVCRYDYDRSGLIGIEDLKILLSQWAAGSLDIFFIILEGWGTVCS